MARSTVADLPIAGVTTELTDEGTHHCLNFGNPPQTPPEVRKYRRSNFAEAGKKVIHPALVEDVAKLDPLAKYGVVTGGSLHVEDVWAHGPQTAYEDSKNAKLEAIYRSHQREPLGRAYDRGHPLPGHVQGEQFRFGVQSDSSESAKVLVYPRVPENDAAAEEQYQKSHKSFPPGEQKRCDYDWEAMGVDLRNHRFGRTEKTIALNNVSRNVAELMSTNTRQLADRGNVVQRITSKRVEDRKNLNDHIGRVKNVGFGGRELPAEHVFGVKGERDPNAWNARDCIEGEYSAEDQAPDRDLGKSQTPGWRNTTAETRAMGAPTIRNDIPARPYQKRSIADNQNYGDDVTAEFLLYPPRFASHGVEDEEFAITRDQQELRDIFERIGYTLSDREFSVVWDRAARSFQITHDGEVSVEEFRNALNDYEEAKDEERGEEWLQGRM